MGTTMSQLDRDARNSPLTLSPEEIAGLPWQPVTRCQGVSEKELYRIDDRVDALISYQPGATTPGRPHPASHHIWVVAGEAIISGQTLTAGSYVYVPKGVTHPITAGQDGCTLFQVHLP